MIIWDPVECLISRLAALRQRYRCLVDGHREFHGERLPVGTEEEILDWIKARYKVLGEFYDVDLSGFRSHRSNSIAWRLMARKGCFPFVPSLKTFSAGTLSALWRGIGSRLRDCEEYRKS